MFLSCSEIVPSVKRLERMLWYLCKGEEEIVVVSGLQRRERPEERKNITRMRERGRVDVCVYCMYTFVCMCVCVCVRLLT